MYLNHYEHALLFDNLQTSIVFWAPTCKEMYLTYILTLGIGTDTWEYDIKMERKK
jgi:hypothetical protein